MKPIRCSQTDVNALKIFSKNNLFFFLLLQINDTLSLKSVSSIRNTQHTQSKPSVFILQKKQISHKTGVFYCSVDMEH